MPKEILEINFGDDYLSRRQRKRVLRIPEVFTRGQIYPDEEFAQKVEELYKERKITLKPGKPPARHVSEKFHDLYIGGKYFGFIRIKHT